MFIHEAVQALSGEFNCIARRNAWWGRTVKIKPTDTVDCCIAISHEGTPGKRWNPQREDLLADDWEIVKE